MQNKDFGAIHETVLRDIVDIVSNVKDNEFSLNF